MEQLIRTWGTALCTAALASGLLQTAAGEGISRRGLRFAAGLYLLLSVLLPLQNAEWPEISLPDESAFSVTQTQNNPEDFLLQQTKAQLCSEIEEHLLDIGVLAIDVDVDIHTDEQERICFDRLNVLLSADDRHRNEGIKSSLFALVGIEPQIQYENG